MITIYRKPRGFLKEDLTLYVSSDGVDSPDTPGTIKHPFQTLNYVLDKNNPIGFSLAELNSFQRIVLLSPPIVPQKKIVFNKRKWQFNILLDDANMQSRRIIDCNGEITPMYYDSPIIEIRGAHEVIIINGIWTSRQDTTDSMIKIMSVAEIAGLSSAKPHGDAYGIEILESLIKDYPQVYRNIPNGNVMLVPAVEIITAGDDCLINGAYFFNNYLCIGLYATGTGFRIQNCVFSNCTKAIISDRRLLTLCDYYNYYSNSPLDASLLNWTNIRNVLKFPRIISGCIFKGVSNIITDYDYFARLEVDNVSGSTLFINGGDLSAVETTAGNYYPISQDELVGDIIVDANYDEFKIVANSEFNGIYPFTITVIDESGLGRTPYAPSGASVFLKAYGQGTYMFGNVFLDKQIDSNKDGVCDYAGNYPNRGYGIDSILYPDPMPLIGGYQGLDLTDISYRQNISGIESILNQVNTNLNLHEANQSAHRELERARRFYFDMNSIDRTIKSLDKEVILYTGDTRTFTYTIVDSEGAPMNLTNYTVRIVFSKYKDSIPVFSRDATILSPTEGVFSFTVFASDTAIPGYYILEYQLIDTNQNKITLAQQSVQVKKSLL